MQRKITVPMVVLGLVFVHLLPTFSWALWTIDSPADDSRYSETADIGGEGTAESLDSFLFRFEVFDTTYQSVAGTSVANGPGAWSWTGNLGAPAGGWPMGGAHLNLYVDGDLHDFISVEIIDVTDPP